MADSAFRKKGCWLTVRFTRCVPFIAEPQQGTFCCVDFSSRNSRTNSLPVCLLDCRSLQDHAEIPVPPSKEDFVMTGNLQKRRGGFGKMSQQRWKNRCFVLLKTGNLCYFQVRDELHRPSDVWDTTLKLTASISSSSLPPTAVLCGAVAVLLCYPAAAAAAAVLALVSVFL